MRVFQRARGLGVVALGIDTHEGQHAQADLAPVDLGAVAGDVALLLEPLDAPPGGRGRQADARGQLGIAQARVVLQLAQDGDVVAVQAGAVRVVAGFGRRIAVDFDGLCFSSGISLASTCLFGSKIACAEYRLSAANKAKDITARKLPKLPHPPPGVCRRMNAPLPESIRKALESVTLDDKYSLDSPAAPS